jgi:hypothetical protein
MGDTTHPVLPAACRFAACRNVKLSDLYEEDTVWNRGLQEYVSRGFSVLVVAVGRESADQLDDLFPGRVHWTFRAQTSDDFYRWAAVVSVSEADALAARTAMWAAGTAVSHCTLCVPGDKEPRQPRAGLVVPKQNTSSFVLHSAHKGLASVALGPCVHADVLHDVLLFDTMEDALDVAVWGEALYVTTIVPYPKWAVGLQTIECRR